MTGATARIILRYGVGAIVSRSAGEALASDPDIVVLVSGAVALVAGAATEYAYRIAKKRGWSL